MPIAYTSMKEFLDRARPGDTFTNKAIMGKVTYVFRTRLTNVEMKSIGSHSANPDLEKVGRGGLLDCIRTQYHKPTIRAGARACYTSIIYGSIIANRSDADSIHMFSFSESLPPVPPADSTKGVVGKILEQDEENKFDALRLERIHRTAVETYASQAAPLITDAA